MDSISDTSIDAQFPLSNVNTRALILAVLLGLGFYLLLSNLGRKWDEHVVSGPISLDQRLAIDQNKEKLGFWKPEWLPVATRIAQEVATWDRPNQGAVGFQLKGSSPCILVFVGQGLRTSQQPLPVSALWTSCVSCPPSSKPRDHPVIQFHW